MPGYWIECSRQKINSDTIWDQSESEHELNEANEYEENPDFCVSDYSDNGGGGGGGHHIGHQQSNDKGD